MTNTIYKLGEPNYLVAAAEHGRPVLVASNQTFKVGDRDFTKYSIIPSVSFITKIPVRLKALMIHGMIVMSTLVTKMLCLSHLLPFIT